jgi:hypothetical protein
VIASFPDRRFQLWEYKVSHGSLLIRSPKGPAVTRNIDLMFTGVEYVSAPRFLRGLVVEYASAEDHAAVQTATDGTEASRLYVLISEGRRHFVAAAGCTLDENDHDIFDSPF